jgi:hypothetical protein
MYNVVGLINYVHFEEIAHQDGSVVLNVDAVGNATCKGPALIAKVTATATVSGTSQKSKTSFNLIQYKNSLFWKTKSTKNTWQPAKAKNVEPFGFVVDNPLPCPNAPTSGGSGGSGSGQPTDTLKDLANAGPKTINGHSDWAITATDVQVDPSTNATSELPLEWDIEQDHPLLDQFTISFSDPSTNTSGNLITKLSSYGKKFTLHKPKKGDTKP